MEVPHPLNSLGKSRRYPLNTKMGRSRSLLERFGDEKNISAGKRSSNPRLCSPLASLYTDHTTSDRLTYCWTCNKWTILTGGNQHRNQSSCKMWGKGMEVQLLGDRKKRQHHWEPAFQRFRRTCRTWHSTFQDSLHLEIKQATWATRRD